MRGTLHTQCSMDWSLIPRGLGLGTSLPEVLMHCLWLMECSSHCEYGVYRLVACLYCAFKPGAVHNVFLSMQCEPCLTCYIPQSHCRGGVWEVLFASD